MRLMISSSAVLTAALLLLPGCAGPPQSPPQVDGSPSDLRASAAAFYESYRVALATPERGAIAGFYHPDGAMRIFNGNVKRQGRAEIDSNYRGAWSPPAYFAWEELAYDSIAPGQVIVTGGFLWQGAGQPDTGRYLYAALLEAADSGLAIRFEHETTRPGR